MATRKPLVIVDGEIQQLQAGDDLEAPLTGAQLASMSNANAGSIVIGAPVYVSGADAVDKAKADASGTKDVFGLVGETSITTSTAGMIATDGVLSATTGQWDAVTGDTGG